MATQELWYCPFKFANTKLDEGEWFCEGRMCGLYDSRMHMCGMFSLTVMAKVFMRVKKEEEDRADDPYNVSP